MRIINARVREDLISGKKLRLNLGAGGTDSSGRYSIDHLELPGVDIVADLNLSLDDIPDNSVSEIYTSHTLEHITNFIPLMRELHRMIMPDGRIEVVVPHFSSPAAFSDPTHVRFFGLYSMYYFVDGKDQPPTRTIPYYYTDIRFKVQSAEIRFLRWGSRIRSRLAPFMTRFWNKSFRRLNFYENHLVYLYPADEIRYVLTPVKEGKRAEGGDDIRS